MTSPRAPATPASLPGSLALIDDDPEFSEYLGHFLRDQGIATEWYADSDDLLCSDRPFDFEFYIVDLMLPGIDGLSLLRLLRKRTQAGILVVSGKQADDVFESVIGTGADMHLAKPVSFEQVLLAIGRVYGRSARPATMPAVPALQGAWRLDDRQRLLLTPDGGRIELSAADVLVLGCLADARGDTVARETLAAQLGLSPDDDPNLLSATIYRLRRRIERATATQAPLQARSRAGYVFRAPLVRA